MRIQGRDVIHPDPPLSELPRHLRHHRAAAAVPHQVQRQLRQRPTTRLRDQGRIRQRCHRDRRNLRRVATKKSRAVRPVELDEKFPRWRQMRLLPTQPHCRRGRVARHDQGVATRLAGRRSVIVCHLPRKGNDPVGHIPKGPVGHHRHPPRLHAPGTRPHEETRRKK